MNNLGRDMISEVGDAEKATIAYAYARDVQYYLEHLANISLETKSKGNNIIRDLINLAKEMVIPNYRTPRSILIDNAELLYNTFITEIRSNHN